MAPKSAVLLTFLAVFCCNVQSASILERSYEYFMNLGKNLGPNLMSVLECMSEDNAWDCAKEKAGKILDGWDNEVQKQRRSWQESADAEAKSSGRALTEMPSKIGRDVEESFNSIAFVVQEGVARAMGRKHKEGGGIDSITISTGGEKKKMKKKKQKPPKIHLVHPMMMPVKAMEKGRNFGRIQSWVIGEVPASTLEAARFDSPDSFATETKSNINSLLTENSNKSNSLRLSRDSKADFSEEFDNVDLPLVSEYSPVVSEYSSVGLEGSEAGSVPRGLLSEAWAIGEKALDAMAEHAMENDNTTNEIEDKSSIAEQRGKKKKKKKAILKLLILGAVLKAKIGTLLQILSFKLQVKFFLIALIGLGINLARFWIDLKKQHQPPQKVIYYEHAQHQHHYEHEDEHGWGPWSRNMDLEDTDVEVEVDKNTPYRAYDKNSIRPLLTRV